MLKEVLFMGVREAMKLEPRQDTVIISILDQFEECNRPDHLHKFRDHLILNFVDTFERPGDPDWPDQMSEEEHKVICKYDEDKAPELSDAKRIVEFIDKYRDAPEEVRLIVHCQGGVSRSAAVAKWAGEFYRVPLPQVGDGIHLLEGANPRVIRLLAKAAGGR
ncbi:dual specificity protein phosphatase family protein [Hydrogenophaga sp. 2FB]|uniref:dual specificity protein phosphatase family protein n=1 Tax=Hydrogenophaga sp. 2FB TaxID=2502187 RepID=UPI0010F81548|nr:dual specificity protein phosphatase family protein [Hydrogenophaga sp. 2FB]